MSESFDLGAVDRFTAGATGDPGERVFYVQARARGAQVTLLAEKEQVRVMAEALGRLLGTLPEADEGTMPADGDLELAEPLEAAWRIGEISIEYDDTSELIGVTITEMQAEEDDDEPGTARFTTSRAQARAMAGHALAVVAAGRPRCQLCGFPIEQGDVHMCPAMNGHRSYRD